MSTVWSRLTRPLSGRTTRSLLTVSLVAIVVVGSALADFLVREQRNRESLPAASSPPPTINCPIGHWCALPAHSDASPGGGRIRVSPVGAPADAGAPGRLVVTMDVCAGSRAYTKLNSRLIFLTADAAGAVVGPAPIVTGLSTGAPLAPGQCRRFQESFADSAELAPVYLDGFFGSYSVYRWRLATAA